MTLGLDGVVSDKAVLRQESKAKTNVRVIHKVRLRGMVFLTGFTVMGLAGVLGWSFLD